MKNTAKLFIMIATALCLIFALAFTACANDGDGGASGGANNNGEGGNQTSGNTDNDGEGGDDIDLGDVLVVYFSATNNTEKIAGYIADITGGTQFELVPQTPYTTADLNYNNRDSRVSKEHDDESLRDIPLVKSIPDNWDTYETVIIGYPIWWGIAAWPVNSFIKDNNFKGKTVAPFCTSASSGIGNSDTQLEEMANGGNWKAGMRFSSSDPKSVVQSWIKALNG